MDEFGMQLRLAAGKTPDWDAATAYASQIKDACGNDEQVEQVVEQFLTSGGPDDVASELLGAMPGDDPLYQLPFVRSLVDEILAGENKFARTVTSAAGERIVQVQPNTGADTMIEAAWRNGPLAVAGFTI